MREWIIGRALVAAAAFAGTIYAILVFALAAWGLRKVGIDPEATKIIAAFMAGSAAERFAAGYKGKP